ncbi:MAG TPA: hypothetical protein PKY05_08730 [Fibrobacteria bacterium]|nr:hypothetical protein [Fibrobacteria bacterium]
MKTILTLTLVAASLSIAIEGRPTLPTSGSEPRMDSGAFRAKFDSLRQDRDTGERFGRLDSAAFHHDGDMGDTGRRVFGEHKAIADSIRVGEFDPARAAAFQAKMDSLRRDWVAKRDSQIARVKDTAVQAQLRDRVKKIEARKVELKAKVEAKKAQMKGSAPQPQEPTGR